MSYSKYVVTFLGSIISGVCLDIAFEEIQPQMSILIMIGFGVVGIGGEVITDILQSKKKRKEAELSHKNQEMMVQRLEEAWNRNQETMVQRLEENWNQNHQILDEKLDRIAEILSVHSLNFDEYISCYTNQQKSLESKVSELVKSVKEIDISLNETLLTTEVQMLEEVADKNYVMSELCTEMKQQMEKENLLFDEMKSVLEQVEDLKNKCDELLQFENDMVNKLEIAVTEKVDELSLLASGSEHTFLGKIQNAMNGKNWRR